MNDTILNTRQKGILDLLKKAGELSRSEIANSLASKKGASRITVIRDLNTLKRTGFVTANGRGRATQYHLKQTNPLLGYIDVDDYFHLEVDERNAKLRFDDTVFDHLSHLYTKREITVWEKSAEKFEKRIKELDPTIYKRELERFVIELSWKSSQIEGNTYSLIEAESLIKQNIEARGHPKEEAVMILNHKDAFGEIIKHTESFKKLTFSGVAELHGVLTKGLATSGIRSQQVRISGINYMPLSHKSELEAALKKLIKTVNATQYPPEKALIVAIMIAYIQPFADGNKRTSRMLANALLLAYGYYPLSYRNVDVNEYRKAILIFYEQSNLSAFKKMFMDQLVFAVDNYFQI